MPFKSKAQQRKCYAMKNKNPNAANNWDCDEWSEETDFSKLPEKKSMYKYSDVPPQASGGPNNNSGATQPPPPAGGSPTPSGGSDNVSEPGFVDRLGTVVSAPFRAFTGLVSPYMDPSLATASLLGGGYLAKKLYDKISDINKERREIDAWYEKESSDGKIKWLLSSLSKLADQLPVQKRAAIYAFQNSLVQTNGDIPLAVKNSLNNNVKLAANILKIACYL